ncbi:unnamed protein product [Prunus brigantina]
MLICHRTETSSQSSIHFTRTLTRLFHMPKRLLADVRASTLQYELMTIRS